MWLHCHVCLQVSHLAEMRSLNLRLKTNSTALVKEQQSALSFHSCAASKCGSLHGWTSSNPYGIARYGMKRMTAMQAAVKQQWRKDGCDILGRDGRVGPRSAYAPSTNTSLSSSMDSTEGEGLSAAWELAVELAAGCCVPAPGPAALADCLSPEDSRDMASPSALAALSCTPASPPAVQCCPPGFAGFAWAGLPLAGLVRPACAGAADRPKRRLEVESPPAEATEGEEAASGGGAGRKECRM